MRTRSVMVLAMAMLLAGAADAQNSDPKAKAGTFTNPLLPSGPDPSVHREGDTYYYMHTLGDRLEIWRTKDIADLANAERKLVWQAPSQPAPNGVAIWAPELHRIHGSWYIYYTAAETGHNDDAHRGIFVLRSDASDPLTGEWQDMGKLKTRYTGIDGTIFTAGGKRYFVYSPYVGPDSVLSIVAMRDPVTLEGPETIIARPDQSWERQGGRQILEGPAFFQGPRGDIYLSYSGSACWSDEYAVGLLHARPGSNLLDAKSWTKRLQPVVAKSVATGVYAPGHNGFFTTPGGETWIVYHANPGPDMRCTPKRSPRIQRVNWTRDGQPVFARPSGASERLAKPR